MRVGDTAGQMESRWADEGHGSPPSTSARKGLAASTRRVWIWAGLNLLGRMRGMKWLRGGGAPLNGDGEDDRPLEE